MIVVGHGASLASQDVIVGVFGGGRRAPTSVVRAGSLGDAAQRLVTLLSTASRAARMALKPRARSNGVPVKTMHRTDELAPQYSHNRGAIHPCAVRT